MTAPATVPCPYCKHQGITTRAFPLTGADAKTVKPDTVRVGCKNGHKFAVKEKA